MSGSLLRRARHRWALVGVAVAVAALALVPAASASIGQPSLTLTPSSGTAASTANLGVAITFSPSGGDTAKDLTLQLPAGLIANAAVDGGACLKSASPVSACQVGSGTVTATAAGLPVPLTLNATFDLVAPPSPADLAGLVVQVTNPLTGQLTPLGSPAAVTLRPSGSPDGVGLNIAFTGIPDTFDGLSISLEEINSTFDGLRFPSSCPATPADLVVSANSYQDATLQTASAPLQVTGCSAAPFAPGFHLTATRDTGDSGTQIVATVTQAADQASTGRLALALPAAVVEPDVQSVLKYSLVCANPASGTCRSIGTARATSPLYPAPLTGSVYLVGNLLAPSVAIMFPSPFPITLAGTLDLATNTTAFSGIPDIPLTDLVVTLNGGPAAAFLSPCQTSSGTATATLTSQNGDHTTAVPSAFRVVDCVAPPTFTGGTGSGKPGRPAIVSASLTGLAAGRPTLRFRLTAGRRAPKLAAFTVVPPSGLRVIARRAHGRVTVRGVSLRGARIRSATLRSGRLVVTLRRAVAGLRATLGPRALRESPALRSRARRGRLGRLTLTVITRSTARRQTRLRLVLKKTR